MDIFSLIGNTPVAEIEYAGRTLLCKLEKTNPSGSSKDRAAAGMIVDALRDGRLKRGGLIVEPTSGNTGISLAMIAASLECTAIMVMPESMSEERRKMITAYGGKLMLTPASQGMAGSIAAAQELAIDRNAFMPMQFDNPANADAQAAMGREFVRQCGKIDGFVSAVGSGGTFSGCAKIIKDYNPKCVCAAVEPAESPVLSGGKAGPHLIQGIGAGFVPKILNLALINRVITVKGADAISAAKKLSYEYGLFVGISSGAAFLGMKELADSLPVGSRIAGVFPDGGERYLSIF